MLCPHCRYPLEESDRICPICGEKIEKESPKTVVAVAEKPAVVPPAKPKVTREKKKPSKTPWLIAIAAALLAGLVVGLGFLFGWWGGSREDAPAVSELRQAIGTLASSQSLTLTADIRSSYGQVSESETVVFKIDRPAKKLTVERTLQHDGVTDMNHTGIDGSGEYTYFKAGNALARGRIQAADTSSSWASVDAMLSCIAQNKPLYDTVMSSDLADRYLKADALNTDGLKADLAAIEALFKDEKWLKDTLGLVSENVDGEQVFTFRFVPKSAATLLVDKLSHSFKDDSAYQNVKNTVSAAYENDNGAACEWVFRVKGGALSRITVKQTMGNMTVQTTVTPSALNQTGVDIGKLKSLILNANQNHVDCSVCAESPAYILGYCEDCYADTMCQSDCGKPAADGFDNRCASCFVKCAACDRHADNKAPDGTAYCDVCYASRYCKNGDGNVVYKDGYCQSCFKECSVCHERYASFADASLLCETCYYQQYCINGDGNAVHQDGFCQACFVPCSQCGQHAAVSAFGDRCEACYNASSSMEMTSCAACKSVLYGNAFEREGHTLCFDCYTGAVSMCHYCQSSVAYFKDGQSALCKTCYDRHILNKACTRCGATGLLLSYGNERLCHACYPDV